jgi:hypothetical protein
MALVPARTHGLAERPLALMLLKMLCAAALMALASAAVTVVRVV